MAATKYSCEQDILCGVHVPKNRNELSVLEQKHLPVISSPDKVRRDETFSVTVEIGKYKVHPNEPAHFIEWIELYAGGTFLFRIGLSGSMTEPKVTVPVKLAHASGPLKAWAKCNMHGLWEGTKEIEVED